MAGWAVDAQAAAEGGDAVCHAAEARPLCGTSAADAVVADADEQAAVLSHGGDGDL